MGSFFTLLIYQPILNLTVLAYQTVGLKDLGITIIGMTIAMRLAMLPLSLKTARSQRAMAVIAPEIERIKEQNKGNMNAQSEAIMKLYKDRGISPLAGCLPLVVQLPILIGLYRVFLNIFKPTTIALLYAAIPHPESINHLAFGGIDISVPNHIVAVLAGALQFIQARIATQNQPQSPQTQMMSAQMMYLLPVMIIVVGWNFPAGLGLYWITTTLVGIGEQLYLRRR